MTYTVTTKVSWDDTIRQLSDMMAKWGVTEWSVIPMRPYRRANEYWWSESERRVTLRYRHPSGREVLISLDAQQRGHDNLRVLYLACEAMRMNEKRGLGNVIADAYLQLEGAKQHVDPYEVLGVRSDAPMTVIEAVYKALAKERHPDAGGSTEAMTLLNEAMERVRTERNGAA
jgi:hypothetical protein